MKNNIGKIVFSGCYGTGKTTLVKNLSYRTGLPFASTATMYDILNEYYPGIKKASELTIQQQLEVGFFRFYKRLENENIYPTLFIDGTVLTEVAYGLARMLVKPYPDQEIIVDEGFKVSLEIIKKIAVAHAKAGYTKIYHLPIEWQLSPGDHDNLTEEFREMVDKILIQLMEEAEIPYTIISGSLEQRIEFIAHDLKLFISETVECPIIVNENTIKYCNIDDALGNCLKRYFTEGFRHVYSTVTDVTIHTGNNPYIEAYASFAYPHGWSVKDGKTLVPHLSSIDFVQTAGQLAQLLILQLDNQQREKSANFTMRSLEVKSGNVFIEDLSSVHVRVELANTALVPVGSKVFRTATLNVIMGGKRGFKGSANVAIEVTQS